MGGGGGSSSAAGRRSMRARVCASVRTPQGVGAVLFVVGGAIVGAAVVAWRRHACGCDGEDTKSHNVEQAASGEVMDGGVVEKEQGKFNQSDENLSRGCTGVEANDLDDMGAEELHQIRSRKATEEVHEIQDEDEIVKDGSDGEPAEKFDQNTSRESVEIIADDTDSREMKSAEEISIKNDVESESAPKASEGVDNSDQSTLSISCSEIVHEEHPEHNDGAQDTALIQTTPTRQMMMHNQQFSEEAKRDTMTESAEIIVDNTDSGDMNNADENSSKNNVENEITLNATEGVDNSDQSTVSISCSEIVHEEHPEDNDGAQDTSPTQTTPTRQMMMHNRQFSEEAKTDTVTESADIIVDDTDSGDMNNADENSSKNNVETEITLNDTEGVDNSDQSTLSISCSGIVHEEHCEHNDGAPDTAPTQTTPTIQTMMQQWQFSEEAKMDTVTETAEAELAKGTTMEKNMFGKEEQKPLAEPAELATSPVSPSLPSLLKPSEKKGFANPGWNKTGMKLKHDSTNGALSIKGVKTQGVAVVTMDRRAASMAILTLIFAVTIGVNIVMRLYSSLQAT